jgi:cell division protein FtsZ
MEQINRHCEQAHVILGAAIDKDLGERLMVTVVAARHGTGAERGAWSGEPASSTTTAAAGLESRLVSPAISSRPASRFVAPPPALTPGKKEQLLTQQSGGGFRQRRNAARMRQGQLSLEIISKGRFEKSEPTIHHGQDLDVPTYIRRGVALN